jgi:hypothetical protein
VNGRADGPLAVRDETVQRGADTADEGADNDRCLAPPGVGKCAKCEGADDRANAPAIEDRRRLCRSSRRSFEPVEELRGRISLVVMLAFGLDNWGQGLLSFLWKGDEWTTISL